MEENEEIMEVKCPSCLKTTEVWKSSGQGYIGECQHCHKVIQVDDAKKKEK